DDGGERILDLSWRQDASRDVVLGDRARDRQQGHAQPLRQGRPRQVRPNPGCLAHPAALAPTRPLTRGLLSLVGASLGLFVPAAPWGNVGGSVADRDDHFPAPASHPALFGGATYALGSHRLQLITACLAQRRPMA